MNVYQEPSSQKNLNDRVADKKTAAPSPLAQRPAIPVLQNVSLLPVQKKETGDEGELLQGQFIPVQQKEVAPLQLKSRTGNHAGQFLPVQRKENQTGLPDNLKAGVENLSGTNLSDVKVHYGSSQPAQFSALAYAQGSDIHIAPGQEQHLPHEAWHVAQQKQGRVQATTQMKGAGINDDRTLEKEADEMGAKAMNTPADPLASGYEHFNTTDIGDIKAKTSLASPAQRQALDSINHELSASIRTINTTGDASVQRRTVTQLVSGKFIADDGQPLKEGQIHKSSFLASMRSEIRQIAAEVLEPVGLAQNNCPDLNYWMAYYQAKDAAYIEAAMMRYAPGASSAANMDEYISSVAAKVKDALVKHVGSGANEFDPEPVPKEVEEKRPALDTLQRKEMPIQFGCGASPVAHNLATPQGLFARLQEINAMTDQEAKCKAICAIYRGGDDPDAKENPDCSTPELRTALLGKLSQCGGSQKVVLMHLMGKRAVDQLLEFTFTQMSDQAKTEDKRTTPILTMATLAAVQGHMNGLGKVLCLSIPDPEDSHAMTFASSTALESKEIFYYLFQGWENRHTIEDGTYTRRMTATQFNTYLTSLATAGNNQDHTVERINTGAIAYKLY